MPWSAAQTRYSHLRQQFALITSSWLFHLFFSSIVLLIVFTWPPAFFKGDTDTARNYLNTIVSSLSTILALCISIILVAIQLTASNYTHRVLDFFVRLPYNGSLFLFYLVTIIHSFFLMAKIHDPLEEPLPVALQPEMSADLVLVVICFLTLLVYMYAVVQLLKPERIITLILREYHRSIKVGRWKNALDSIEQVCDIAKRAASVSDSVTGVRCVEAMLEVASQLPLPDGREDPLLEIHRNVIDQWVEIVAVSVKEKETGLLNAGVNALYVQGSEYMEGNAWPAAELVVQAFRHLVFGHFLSEGQVFYVERVVARLYKLAAKSVVMGERGQLFSLRTWQVIQTIGEHTFASQPAATATLLEGFLMSREIAETLEELERTDYQYRAASTYYGVWKAFGRSASMRDAARWATWWKQGMSGSDLSKWGQHLAVLLSLHLHRHDVAKTLCHVFGINIDDVTITANNPQFDMYFAELFDGWPWRHLVEIRDE